MMRTFPMRLEPPDGHRIKSHVTRRTVLSRRKQEVSGCVRRRLCGVLSTCGDLFFRGGDWFFCGGDWFFCGGDGGFLFGGGGGFLFGGGGGVFLWCGGGWCVFLCGGGGWCVFSVWWWWWLVFF